MTWKPTSKHSIVVTPAGGLRFSSAVRDHSVPTDQPLRLGGSDTAPSPLELLSVSLASCVALYVHRYCEARSLDAEQLVVEATPFWRDDPGRIARFDVVVHVPDSIPAEHHAAIEEVARGCPVHHTLASSPAMTLGVRELALTPAVAAD
jgi:putative redox protein